MLAALAILAVTLTILHRESARAKAAGLSLLLAAPLPGATLPEVRVRLGTFADTERPFQYVLLRTNAGLVIELHELAQVTVEPDGTRTKTYAARPCQVWRSRSTVFTAAGRVRPPDPSDDCTARTPIRFTVTITEGDVSLATEDSPELRTQTARKEEPCATPPS